MASETRPPRARVTHLVTADGETHPVTEPRERGRAYNMNFTTTFTDPVADLATKLKSAVALKLVMILPKLLSYQHWRRLDQVTVGAQIGADNSTISRAMRELEEQGFLERRGRGPVIEWRLTEYFGWKGTVEAFHDHKTDRAKQKAEMRGTASNVAEGILWNFFDRWKPARSSCSYAPPRWRPAPPRGQSGSQATCRVQYSR
jgi:DNA-binding transcriptional MocR family regulator